MNPLCFVCESPATRVCKYEKCSSPAFYCSGPCTKGISEKMHKHEQGEDFISYSQFEKKLLEIKEALDPCATHKQYLENMRKKVNLTKDHLLKQIDNLDRAYHQLEKDLHENLYITLVQEQKNIFEQIEAHQTQESASGGDLNKLLSDKPIFIDQKKVQAAISQIREAFEQQLQEISKFNTENIFISYNQRMQKSKLLYDEGITLKNNKQYRKAVNKLKQARQINNFDSQIHFWIGWCLFSLDQQDEAEQSFRQSLELNPYQKSIHLNIGHICQIKHKYQQAIDQYSKEIKLNSTSQSSFSNRGYCYLQLKRYQQATFDYLSALKLNPNTKQYTQEIEEIAKLMNSSTK